MTEPVSRPVVSRRSRPAKSALSRELIVTTALDILQQDGLAGLSLRRVATALETGAASLYVYIANLDDLHALMLDQALAAVQWPDDAEQPWRQRLKAGLLSYLHVLHARPGLAQVAMSTIACGPHFLRICEILLGLLRQGGVNELKAAWGVDLLILYVTAIAAEQSLRAGSDQALARVRDALAAVSALDYPLIFAAQAALLGGSGEERGNWALDVLIDGIVAGRAPSGPPG